MLPVGTALWAFQFGWDAQFRSESPQRTSLGSDGCPQSTVALTGDPVPKDHGQRTPARTVGQKPRARGGHGAHCPHQPRSPVPSCPVLPCPGREVPQRWGLKAGPAPRAPGRSPSARYPSPPAGLLAAGEEAPGGEKRGGSTGTGISTGRSAGNRAVPCRAEPRGRVRARAPSAAPEGRWEPGAALAAGGRAGAAAPSLWCRVSPVRRGAAWRAPSFRPRFDTFGASKR